MNLTDAFLADTVSPADFDHRAHVVVAYELLRRYEFNDAHVLYVRHLKALTERAGVPEKFNASITFTAMSLIAERMAEADSEDAGVFLAHHPDLLRARTLTARYSPDRLSSPLARAVPLLPDRAAIAD